MAERKWTREQKLAIDARSGSLLVAAAAGSGKTAVLVERIIGLLTDRDVPLDPSELLAVTFTNAAAAELRDRISAAVNELVYAHPEIPHYGEIKMKLPDAQICTMDSFCIRLVRENYHILGIEPDFTVLDDSDLRNMYAQAMDRVMAEESEKEIYHTLISVTGTAGNDRLLSEKIHELYIESLSYPFPREYLDAVSGAFASGAGSERWKSIIRLYAYDGLMMCANIAFDTAKSVEEDDLFGPAFFDKLTVIEKFFENAAEIVRNASWNDCVSFINSAAVPSYGRTPSGHAEESPAKRVKLAAKTVTDTFKKLQTLFCATDEENLSDCEKLSPIVAELCACAERYAEYLSELKEMRNAYGFSDFIHMALGMLITKNSDGDTVRTEMARSISLQFGEILIDEYQDTNDAQNMLFAAISRNGSNLFTVGDVKQSIYSFRQAKPDIFMKKSDEYPDYDGESCPSKIILGKNFRSRKGVLDAVNYLFEYIMTRRGAGIDYNENEKLYFGGLYGEDKEIPFEMHMICADKSDPLRDAEYIGSIINNMMSSGFTVQDKNGERRAKYKDFCILLRSTKSKAEIYAKALENMGIPAYAEKRSSLFDTTEISMFMSLVRTADNPCDDIAVLAAMYSPLYGFTPDELAVIRSNHRGERLFNAVRLAAQSGDNHCKQFCDDIASYRNMSAVFGVGEYIGNLLELTGFARIVGAMPGGDARRTNLYMLAQLARQYEDSGGSGTGGFIAYIDRCIKNGAQIPAGGGASADADVVRIMSIHKSKGLEFPVVILADCSSKFNEQDLNAGMILNDETGLGMKIYEPDNLKKYDTLSYAAARISGRRSLRAEEMRILYVALTRAREKLITVARVKSPWDAVNNAVRYGARADSMGYFESMSATSYFDWLMGAFVRHTDAAQIRSFGDFEDIPIVRSDFSMKFGFYNPFADNAESFAAEQAEPNADLVHELKERCDYIYPYRALSEIPIKRTASQLEKERFTPDFFAKSKPAFLSGDELTPAQRGSANHLFLQLCDFDRARDDYDGEKRRLVSEGLMSEKQADVLLDGKLKKFFKTELFARMMNARSLYRERQFSVFLPAYMFAESLPDYARHKEIFVQGMTDAIFVEDGKAYVVDYKTDRTNDMEELKRRYSPQLEIYKLAVAQSLRLPVGGAYIFSVYNGESIEV